MVKVSIIIPCYNAISYIDKCLKSIIKDKLKEKEIILINDGSTDKTQEMLEKWSKKHDNIKIIKQKNGGQGVARNNALKKAKGEYIFFLDIDDYVAPNIFFKMYNFAKENNSDYVYCDYFEHYADKDLIIKNNHSQEQKSNAILANFAPWGKLMSSKLIKDIDFKFCEGKIFEDVAVIPHIASKSSNPKHFEEPLYYYNMTNISTTRKKQYDKRYEDMIFVSDYLYNLFEKDNTINKYEEELKYIYLDSILKSGILKFAKYKEGLKNIPIIKKNVYKKFPKLIKNKYYKQETIYRKITTLIALYTPAYLLYLLKKIK